MLISRATYAHASTPNFVAGGANFYIQVKFAPNRILWMCSQHHSIHPLLVRVAPILHVVALLKISLQGDGPLMQGRRDTSTLAHGLSCEFCCSKRNRRAAERALHHPTHRRN